MVALALLALSVSLFAQTQQSLRRASEQSSNYSSALIHAMDIATRVQLNPQANYLGDWQAGQSSQCNTRNQACTPEQLASADKNDILSVAQQSLPSPSIDLTQCASYTCVNISWGAGDCTSGQCLQLSFVARQF